MNKIFEDGKKYCGKLDYVDIYDSSNLENFEANFVFVDDRGGRISKYPRGKDMAYVFFDDLRRMDFEISLPSSPSSIEDAVRAVNQIRDEIRKGKPPRIEIDIERGGLLRHILRRLPEETPLAASMDLGSTINTGTEKYMNENEEAAKAEKKTKLRLQRTAIRGIEDLMDWLEEHNFSEQEKQDVIARLQQTLDEFSEGL